MFSVCVARDYNFDFVLQHLCFKMTSELPWHFDFSALPLVAERWAHPSRLAKRNLQHLWFHTVGPFSGMWLTYLSNGKMNTKQENPEVFLCSHRKTVWSLLLITDCPFACYVCSVIHHTSYLQLCYLLVLLCVCQGCRRRRRLWWSFVSRICLWGICLRSPVLAPARWSCAVKDWWNTAPPSCRVSTSVFLTSTQSCRTGTCVSPGTGRAELEDSQSVQGVGE